MEYHSQKTFINQFIQMIRQGVKKVGVVTDKDGTILLDDTFIETLKNFNEKKMGVKIYLIVNSGRTIKNMINCLEEDNIPIEYIDYIIGDNGGMCYDVKKKKILYKHLIDTKTASKVIQKFIEMGGNIEDIRYVDGTNTYAFLSEDVKEYYKDKKDIQFKKDITNIDGIDISKITFVGSHELMDSFNRYLKKNFKKFKTHMGRTSFPRKERNNYRMDFTRHEYKRRCSKIFKEKTKN